MAELEETEEFDNYSSPAYIMRNLALARDCYIDSTHTLITRRNLAEVSSIQICFYISCALKAFKKSRRNPTILIFGGGLIGSRVINDLIAHGCKSYLRVFCRSEESVTIWRSIGLKSDVLMSELMGMLPPDIIIFCMPLNSFPDVSRELLPNLVNRKTFVISAVLGLQRRKIYSVLKTPCIFRTFIDSEMSLKRLLMSGKCISNDNILEKESTSSSTPSSPSNPSRSPTKPRRGSKNMSMSPKGSFSLSSPSNPTQNTTTQFSQELNTTSNVLSKLKERLGIAESVPEFEGDSDEEYLRALVIDMDKDVFMAKRLETERIQEHQRRQANNVMQLFNDRLFEEEGVNPLGWYRLTTEEFAYDLILKRSFTILNVVYLVENYYSLMGYKYTQAREEALSIVLGSGAGGGGGGGGGGGMRGGASRERGFGRAFDHDDLGPGGLGAGGGGGFLRSSFFQNRSAVGSSSSIEVQMQQQQQQLRNKEKEKEKDRDILPHINSSSTTSVPSTAPTDKDGASATILYNTAAKRLMGVVLTPAQKYFSKQVKMMELIGMSKVEDADENEDELLGGGEGGTEIGSRGRGRLGRASMNLGRLGGGGGENAAKKQPTRKKSFLNAFTPGEMDAVAQKEEEQNKRGSQEPMHPESEILRIFDEDSRGYGDKMDGRDDWFEGNDSDLDF